MNFLVPKVLLEQILQYLGSQPYVSVANLIQGVGQCVLDPRDVVAGKRELEAKQAALKEKIVDIKPKVIKKAVKKGRKPTSDSSKS